MPSLDSRIDELYQRPLDEFTSARNAFAKTLSGEAKRQVASLKKPTVSLWAVNQLYWRSSATYKALVDASEKLRTAHRAVLGGKKADLRKAEHLHRDTLERAMGATSKLLARGEGVPSEAVLATVRRVLASLPVDERPGRLTQEPPPAGFSLLEGVVIKAQPDGESASRTKSAAEERRGKNAEELEKKAEAARLLQEAQAQRALDRARRAERHAAERRRAAEEKVAALARK